jgi:hypothetical protein
VNIERYYRKIASGIYSKSIGIKFLVLVGILIIIFSSLVVYSTWSHSNAHTRRLLDSQAEMALQFNLAIREYVVESIRPFTEQYVHQDEFVPETMSTSFVARSIFEKVRSRFPDCTIKYTSDNPRNLNNKASDEELEMIRYFNENPQAQ